MMKTYFNPMVKFSQISTVWHSH